MPPSRPPNDLMKYSSIGIQLMVIILIFTFGGKWLDGKAENEKPVFTAIGAISGVVISMIYLIRETSRGQKNKK